MVQRIVNPKLFAVEAALIDWTRVVRRSGLDGFTDADYEALRRSRPRVHLRWAVSGKAGFPTGPFTVWRRKAGDGEQQPEIMDYQLDRYLYGNLLILKWYGPPMAVLRIKGEMTSEGVIYAFSGVPSPQNVVATVSLQPGTFTAELRGPLLTTAMIYGSVDISEVAGIPAEQYGEPNEWTEQEVVGLPIDDFGVWSTIGSHTDKQGLMADLGDPIPAALARLDRGAPPIGWPHYANGMAVPAWERPDPGLLIEEAQRELLSRLADILRLPPEQQAGTRIEVTVPRPVNSAGQRMSGPDSTGLVSPFALAMSAASIDPFFSLALGMGTALDAGEDQLYRKQIYDYMITAPYAQGLDGNSEPIELAALALDPQPPPMPPVPAALDTDIAGMQRPYATDEAWRASVIASWSRLPATGLFRVASFAAARLPQAPAGQPVLLLEQRDSGGHRPIGGDAPPQDDQQAAEWAHASDGDLPIPPNPGTAQTVYAVSTQNIFGMWSPWSTAERVDTQPGLDHVGVLAATFRATAPPSGKICPGVLEIDLSWDWRVRSVSSFTLVGRLFAAPLRNSPAPDTSVPGGLARNLGGGGAAISVSFNGNAANISEGQIRPMKADGSEFLPGPDTAQAVRRYRLTIPGFSVDFGATSHAGLALWIRARERIAPHRYGPWQANPILTYASDPVPPPIERVVVPLSSLPDAAGFCHHRVAWKPAQGAIGYNLYASDESAILDENGIAELGPSATLEQRMIRLRDAFIANPSRRTFTKVNDRIAEGTSLDVKLPRGSTAIHLHVALPISAGGVEGVWPVHDTMFEDNTVDCVAAPRLLTPTAPTLEVRRVLDTTAVPQRERIRIELRSNPGPRVQRYELFRTRVEEAALDVDTMGPPVAVVDGATASYQHETVYDEHFEVEHLVSANGHDDPDGSWKRVWYRAVAWSHPDLYRGGLVDRSPGSHLVSAVLPPNGPPDLSAITATWPGGDPNAIRLNWTSTAPIAPTPLGPHRLVVSAQKRNAPGEKALLAFASTLDKVAYGSDPQVWRTDEGGAASYHATVSRAALADALAVTIRLTDPLGRLTERFLDIEGGSALVRPDIFDVQPARPPIVGLTFRTSAPLTPPPQGAYRLAISATFQSSILRPLSTRTYSSDLHSIPTQLPINPRNPIEVARIAGSKPLQFAVRLQGTVRSLQLRIIAPDGRYAEYTGGAVR
ncbi:hypothetical protein [Paradevosia shaoguanensis]|uniref:hypothetical protein n=1 Tax=Paradevosia shaoguanensis TaxID=1335043 RepID=UPI0019347405|nr:hypothetical protein [Paradevosia shaoguanensis]